MNLELGENYNLEDDVNKKADILIGSLCKTFEKKLPLRKRKRKKQNVPWMNTGIIETAMKKRNRKQKCYLETKLTKTEELL